MKIRRKARSDWLPLMPNAHEGYVSWAIRTVNQLVYVIGVVLANRRSDGAKKSREPHDKPCQCKGLA